MNLKRLVSLILIFSLVAPSSVFASSASFHVDGEEENLVQDDQGNNQVCSAPPSDINLSSTCDPFAGNPNEAVDELEPVNDALGTQSAPTCNDQDLSADGKPLSKEDALQIKKDLLKQCNEQFKGHKRKFAKQLFKKGRIFKALGVLLRKKKKLKDIKHKKFSQDIRVEGETLDEVDAKIKAEEQRIMDEINAQYPGGSSGNEPYYNDNGKLIKPKFSYGVDGKMSPPAHVYLKDGDKSCKIDIDLPKVDDVDLPPSNLMPPLDITDSFPDDCAFMVSDKFKEADALKLLGSSTRTDYCSNNQQIDKSDEVKKDKSGKTAFDYLDNLAGSFKNAAVQGMTPSFTLNVTRNLYADETRPLAQKRGEFIQKYMFDQIQKQMEEVEGDHPKWATDYSEFQKVFKLQHPSYEGNSTVGDYGPDPMAKSEDWDKEKQNLKATLEAKNTQTKDDIAKIEDKTTGTIKKYTDDLAALEKKKLDVEKQRVQLNNNMERRTDFTNVNQDVDKLNQLTTELFNINYDIAKTKRDLDQEKQMLTYYKGKLVKNNPDQQVKLLDEYYKGRPENFDRDYKNKWDDKLFKNFKMVAVEGTFGSEKLDDIEMDDDVTPKIKYMIENKINAETFSCDYSMKDVKNSSKRHRNKGNYKWGKAIARVVWNPIWVSVKFTAGFGWLVGLLGAAKKVTTSDCPNFDDSAFGRYMKWGNIKKYHMGKKGTSYRIHKDPIKYNGDYDKNVWPEAQKMFDR